MARYETANTVINDAALEVGLLPVTDVYSSTNDAFIQLRGLLTSCGRELAQLHDWVILQRNFTLNTGAVPPADGLYDLPDDFSAMIDQTGWNVATNLPIGGPVSPQVWSVMVGRDLGSTTLYVNFRLTDNKIQVYPLPAPANTELSFMYLSRNWVQESGGALKDRPSVGSDIILFEPILIVKYLTVKYLSAKGFDTTQASRELDLMFQSRIGKNAGAQILNASGANSGYPYITPWNNVPYTGYGF